jgi:hypothetical protein
MALAATPKPGEPFPKWDQKLRADNGSATGCNSSRFTCIFDDKAVRDNETGLVWSQPIGSSLQFRQAFEACETLTDGGRFGWRLPSVTELRSLQVAPVPDVAPIDLLPAGHPFLHISNDAYWSSTPWPTAADSVAALRFFFGSPCSPGLCGLERRRTTAGDTAQTWCVRGGAFE